MWSNGAVPVSEAHLRKSLVFAMSEIDNGEGTLDFGLIMSKLLSFLVQHWERTLTLLIALYGAVLSTYNARTARKRDVSQVIVTVKYGHLVFGPEVDDDEKLLVSASNPSQHPIKLTGVGLRLPDKRTLIWPEAQGDNALPFVMEAGTGCTHWHSTVQINKRLKLAGYSGKLKLRGFYNDALDRTHLSKAVKFEVE
jgi:hypothetical protein